VWRCLETISYPINRRCPASGFWFTLPASAARRIVPYKSVNLKSRAAAIKSAPNHPELCQVGVSMPKIVVQKDGLPLSLSGILAKVLA